MTRVTHLLIRQSIFPKLTLFLYRSLFITYLCFCFNCKRRSVNIYQLFHLTPCYKAFFLYQYQNARAKFVCVVVCLKVDLNHVLLISRTFNSDNFIACDPHRERYRLNQTFDTCKRELVSGLAACYKLTTSATSRKSSRVTVGNIPQVLQHPYQRWMTTLRSHGCKLIACNKIVGSKKT